MTHTLSTKIQKVITRSDEIVSFDIQKITKAIQNAFFAVGKVDNETVLELTGKVIKELNHRYHGRTIPAIEEIQDIVEKIIMEAGHADVARAYIIYREQHSRIRSTKDMMLDIDKTMDGYLNQSDWRVNENSSVNYSLGGLILHNSGAITANYWLNNIYSKEIGEAHKSGDFHIHDLSMFSGYCAGWSLRQLLEEGLGGVRDKINSRPAKHLSTAINHITNFLGTMQNEWAGAQAFSSFDTYLAPFIRTGNLSYKQVKQNIQSFVYSVNIPSRWGSQSPFSNITLDWTCPQDLKDQAAIVGGVGQDFTYGDCAKEMEMLNKAFLEVMMAGDADGRGFAYPIPTYNITKDFNWETENANLLFQMTADYGTPYFQNFVNSDLDPSDVRSMCCRLQLDKRELRKRGGGLFGADEFTGSIGVVTINLPRLGFTSKTKEDLYRKLDDLMVLAKNSLEVKRQVVNKLLKQGLFPYTSRYLKHLNNHFSTIGINGMHECCMNFMNKSLTTEEGQEFANEILIYMRDRLADFQEETGALYNLEATPAEGTSYRLAKVDAIKYPGIYQSGEDVPYYTNSSALPVGHTDDMFTALELQEDLQTKYTGGTVFHGFLGEQIKDIESCKKLVQKIANGYKIPYFSISPTYSVCPDHGRVSGEHFSCPQCMKECEVYSRITGYYRPVQNWNKGKKSEYQERNAYNYEASMASKATRGTRVIATGGQKFKFFYSDTCSKCPPVKDHVRELGLAGEFINVSTPEGIEVARKLNVRSLPSVAFYNGRDELVDVVQTIDGVNQCISVGS
ncbi:MAG: ribonucleoside triphosphate reductase [Bacteriovoracaceae bacterium]|nr:ribonucleoside triphosphate reductase [Bacteriovoracaceae bacterium]